MSKLSKNEIGVYYIAVMEALKIRLQSIEQSIQSVYGDGKRARPEDFPKIEFCYLQLRMVAELIALAVLVTQNEHPEARKRDILKAYRAGEIFERLEKVNSNCFPIAMRIVGEFEFGNNPNANLTRGFISDLYASCGNFLHVGSLKSMLKGRKDLDPIKVAKWSRDIYEFLKVHRVEMQDGEFLVVLMESPKLNGGVDAFFASPP